MQKAGVLILILIMGFPILLAAQDEPDVEPEWEEYSYDFYARGDQVFIVSLGVAFPTVFVIDGNINNSGWKVVGGAGTLIFNYYLSPKFYLGAELSGMFVPTIGGNTAFIIPLGIRAGTQFTAGRFEFPLAGIFGVSLHTFLGEGYFGIFLKASASALFKATTQWAFGITTSWYFMPEWTGDSKTNVYGNFLDLMLTARYHF